MGNPADLEAAIDAGDWPRVLDLALSAWRESRAVELADLIDILGARAGRVVPWPDVTSTYLEWAARHGASNPVILPARLPRLQTIEVAPSFARILAGMPLVEVVA